MKIGILVTGHPAPKLAPKYGEYNKLFEKLLAGQDLEFEAFFSVDDEAPDPNNVCDGYLVTGSGRNVTENAPWMGTLSDWLAKTYGQKPIVGVCFGHQILAHALGGRVDVSGCGWTVGVTPYQRVDGGEDFTASAWHQYEVAEAPTDARAFIETDTCRYAGLTYGDKALSYQMHPEFDDTYLAELYEDYSYVLSAEARQTYQRTLGRHRVNHKIGEEIGRFFKTGSIQA